MSQLTAFFRDSSPAKMALLCVVVGIGGGVGAIFFHYLIEISGFIFYWPKEGTFFDTVVSLPWYVRILVPTLGGLIVGIILSHEKVKDAEGEGVPEVIEAIAVERSKIRPLIVPVKALVSAISIGSGGAGGREGPIIQIGSAIGSSLGQLLKLDQGHTRVLLAAGAAAAIGGTFNAPIAGVLFALEVLLRSASIRIVLLLATSSLVGTVFVNVLIERKAPFDVPDITLLPYTESLLLAGIGVVAALIAVAFTSILFYTDHVFKRLPLPSMWKPALGGLILGVLALAFPQVHEQASYHVLTELFTLSSVTLVFLTMLIGAKIVATSLTVGSGGSGGILAPSLFIGALLGSIYGKAMAYLFPTLALGGVPAMVIGMGAVFAGTAHAPLTAIALIFEFTDSYLLLAPLVIACFVSAFIAQSVGKQSMYSAHIPHRLKLKR